MENRNVILLFDEMHIRRELEYDGKKDIVQGYADNGKMREPELAKCILVFMIRGLFCQYKYISSYYTSAKGLTGKELVELIEDNVTFLSDVGFRIVATVCDQGSNNRNAYKILGVSVEKPYFYLKDKGTKIFALFDTPHLFKSVRNNLIKSDIDTPDGPVSWGVIKDLYEAEKNNATKLCPKITYRHVYPNTFEKMRVALATQVFSRTVVAGIRTMHELDKFSNKNSSFVLATANFFEIMDKLFDNLNSKTLYSKNNNRSALKPSNHIVDNLVIMKTYVEQLKCKNTTINYCFKGLLITINGILQLSNSLFKETPSIEYVITSRLNQDPLENTFSIVRGKGGHCKNPSVLEFSRIVAQIMCIKFLKNTNLSNCEYDDEEMISSLNQIDGMQDYPNNEFEKHDTEIEINEDSSELLVEENSFKIEDFLLQSQTDENLDLRNGIDDASLNYFIGTPKDASHDLLGSQRVYKKSSPNSMLTIYIPTRELVSRNGIVAPLKGVLYADTKFIQGHRIFGQLTLTFRYGREDEEVMGLRFCNEAVMCLTQIWPPNENKTDEKDALTPLQDALIKRLGEGTFPFTMEVTPQAPPSVQLVPAKRYYGAPIGTSYDIRCFVADRSDEKLHRRSTVRMGVRLIHKTNINNLQLNKAPENFTTIINNQSDSSTSPPTSSTSASSPNPLQSVRSCKNDRYDSFSKLKLSPKAFRFTGKLCRSKSEIEKSSNDFYEGITNDFESTRGPQGSVDKPFLLQEGKVCLRASLDKSVYAHGENVDVTVDIKNDSRKTVRRIRVTAIQHVDVCMFSNGKFKNVVAESDASLSDISVKPCSTLHTTYSLHPQRGPTKNWIALEDSLQRCNEPNAITALIASSALRNPASINNPDERNVFAIYVSYYIKVKLTLSGMGGELSLKLPFTLAHIETNNSIKCDTDHVEHSPHNQQLLINNNKCDHDNDSKLNLNLDSITSSSTTANNLLVNQSASSSTTTTTTATINLPQKSASQQAAASLTSSFRNCNISFSNKSKLLQQQQSTQDHDSEALDKIEQITTEDITVDQEQNNVKRKSMVMLKHTRQNTLQISSIDDDKDDEDDDDNSIVGTTANDLLNSPDYDMRKNTETTCVEVHASSS